MKTKLTLSIDKELVERAKSYAKKEGRSLSQIIENYLETIISQEPSPEEELSDTIKSLRGSFKAPEGFEYKNELIKSLLSFH